MLTKDNIMLFYISKKTIGWGGITGFAFNCFNKESLTALHTRCKILEPLQPGREAVAVLLGVDHRLRGDPIELDGASRTGNRLVAVPGIVGSPERQQRAAVGRHFGDVVVEIVGPTQEPKTPRVLLPALVHVEQDGDDLGLRVGVDRAVAFAHIAAHRVHGRPTGQVDVELAFDRRLELRTAQLVDQRAEMPVDLELRGRMRSRPRNLRIISDNGGEILTLEEVGNDDEIEGVALERRTLQPGEVAIAHRSLQLGARRAARRFGASLYQIARTQPRIGAFQPSTRDCRGYGGLALPAWSIRPASEETPAGLGLGAIRRSGETSPGALDHRART